MISAGIDVGIEYIKAVIIKDGKIVAKEIGNSGGEDRPELIKTVWEKALKSAGVAASDVPQIIATGKGKFDCAFATDKIADPVATAAAAKLLSPEATTVVDIGADEILVITLKDGKIVEQLINQKCSAGIGLFLEGMADRLGLDFEEMNQLNVPYDGVEVNDGCVVFAELEALGYMNQGECPKKIAMAMFEAVAVRAYSVIIDIYKQQTEQVALYGGMTKSPAFIRALSKVSNLDYFIPADAEFAAAIGAAAVGAA